MKPTLVIMAAGMGSRYGGLKQIDPVGPDGEIVMDYSIFDAIRAGFGKVVFIVRKDIESSFRDVIEPHVHGRVPFAYVPQELEMLPPPFRVPEGRTKPWGTTHAILCCRDAVNEPFGVINADDFYGRTSFEALSAILQKRRLDEPRYALIGYLLKNTLSAHGSVSRGICDVDAAGRLLRVVEHPSIEQRASVIHSASVGTMSGDAIVSMNMWGFTPAVFPQLERIFASFLKSHVTGHGSQVAESYIPAAIDELVRDGAAVVDVAPSPDTWLGMTYPEDKPAVRAGIAQLIARGEYPAKLWS